MQTKQILEVKICYKKDFLHFIKVKGDKEDEVEEIKGKENSLH